MSQRKLRVGMVGGGGPANFFGAPHRRAIVMDNSAEVTAGALRTKPDESIAAARELFIPRAYGDWEGMMKAEAALPESERIDYITIVTPNDAHFGPADAAAAAGIGVLCEKPLTTTLDEAQRLYARVRSKNSPFVVAYTYTGFAMVMLAPKWCITATLARSARSKRGIRRAGWPPRSKPTIRSRPRGASNPSRSGASGCGGDIGTHAYEFVRFVAGLSATRLRARLKAFVPGRALDDDFTVLAELHNGAIATITASQVTIGAQNDNGFRIIGTNGTLEWSITDHSVLKHYAGGQPVKLYRQGAEYPYFPASVKPYLRLPSGHPEGLHEALANLHRTLEWTIRGARGEKVPKPFEHPGIADGVAGMAFIEAAVASSKRDGDWVEVPKVG